MSLMDGHAAKLVRLLAITGFSVVAVESVLKRLLRRYLTAVCDRSNGFACAAGPFVDASVELFVRSCALGALVYRVTGLDPRQIVQGAGISGLLIAYLVRDVIENFQAGLLLVTQPPFNRGDYITIRAQMLDHAGHVVGIDLRHTLLRQDDGRTIRIPNSLLLKSILRTPSLDAEQR